MLCSTWTLAGLSKKVALAWDSSFVFLLILRNVLVLLFANAQNGKHVILACLPACCQFYNNNAKRVLAHWIWSKTLSALVQCRCVGLDPMRSMVQLRLEASRSWSNELACQISTLAFGSNFSRTTLEEIPNHHKFLGKIHVLLEIVRAEQPSDPIKNIKICPQD